jgi:hypothetical protein
MLQDPAGDIAHGSREHARVRPVGHHAADS